MRFVCSFFLAILLPFGLVAAEYTIKTIPNVRLSDRHNHVSNPDGILTPKDVQAINSQLNMLEDSLGIEVAVVAVESIGDEDARSFATDLFAYWGIGKNSVDNGLLIQLVTEPSQRSVVFETGYGLEGVLPDAICYRLQQQYMLPEFKVGNYSTGMLNGVLAVKDYLMASDYEREAMVGESSDDGGDIPFLFIISVIAGFPLLLIVLSVVAYRHKYRKRICPRCGQKTFVYVGRKTIRKPTYSSEGLAEDLYRCSNCDHTELHNHTLSRLQRSSPVIIGGGGGSGRSGGFGGGGSWGGGRSGGGGSISRF